MGATVVGYWPGITHEQLENQPGFFNDCKAWGDWMAVRYDHPAIIALHKSLGIEALLSHTTEGMKASEVAWVSPQQLASAASRLRDLVLANDPRVQPLLKVYAEHSNEIDPVDQEFAQDLLDVAAIADYASGCGVSRMTLEVSW
ncbi:MAG: hypothetical protein JWN24_490 [Phycisphaerales bacterium]|nr:hypothetical protein [Phycisphaerales bacterium]